MVCPICDAEVYEHDVESCWVCECETPLTNWEESQPEYCLRPLKRCSRCGECPNAGDRSCRQCQAYFLKRTPAWLDTDFPGWYQCNGQDSIETFHCISCGLQVVLGAVQCETCGLNFYRPTEHSLEVYVPGIGMVTLGLEPEEDKPEIVPCTYAEQETFPAPVAVPLCTAPLASVTHQPIFSLGRDLAHRIHSSEGIAAVVAACIIPPRSRLLAERQASYKALLTSGKIRPVPSLKWLSGQPIVCDRGHRSQFGLFAYLPGYGILDSLPDFKEFGRHNLHTAAFYGRGGAVKDNINDRDPELDVQWQLGCPMCGTDRYKFEGEALRDYAMCTASPDLFWVFCHLYRKDLGACGNCEVRRNYWDALRLLG